LVTIDGEDSRDFDDAVYCEPQGKGWRLLVAIADVAAYVRPGTALDDAALERGTSVYFPDRVIPMLPEILSNEWCSLNPQVDRLCLVCELFINKFGGVRKIDFHQGIMRSAARLTYTQVAALIEKDDDSAVPAEVVPHVRHLFALYQVLKQRREKRGAIDFDTVETRILYDDQGKISNIVPTQRNEAHKLIEEMMLAANVAAAEWLAQRQMPFLYRVHEGPNAEKLTQLRSFLGELGLRLYGNDEPQAKHYAKLLSSIQDRVDVHLIQTVMLRSLRLAVYSPDNAGHFGLAYEAYTHFTSPIRRYPDLLVHRAIRHCLQGKDAASFHYGAHDMTGLGEHCSMTERRADEATRDAVEWLKCEYMLNKVGESYQGFVTGVTAFGLFVELQGIFVEGLIHVTALRNDYYHFDPAHHRLHGERSGRVYQLSDHLRVQVARVDLEQRKIDFVLVE
jgi:ribonuclease R